MEKKDLEQIAKVIKEEHNKSHDEMIEKGKAYLSDFLGIDLNTTEGREDCKSAFKSARDVRDTLETGKKRFWWIFYGGVVLGFMGILVTGFKEWLTSK